MAKKIIKEKAIEEALWKSANKLPTQKGTLPSNYYAGLSLDRTKLTALLDETNKIDTQKDPEHDLIERVYEFRHKRFRFCPESANGF